MSHPEGSGLEGWFAPAPRSAGLAPRSALVLVTDPRAAVAATLVLQEMGYTVDLGAEPSYALRWLRRARYDVVLAGGVGVASAEFAARLRAAAPDARILLMSDRDLRPGDLPPGPSGVSPVEVLRLPMDVNTLVERFLPED